MKWFKTHSLILSILFLYFISISVIYVSKLKAKEQYLGAKFAKVELDVHGKHCPKEKQGKLIVKAIFKTCPTSSMWGELIADVDFRCDTKVLESECRKVTRHDFFINDEGLVIR